MGTQLEFKNRIMVRHLFTVLLIGTFAQFAQAQELQRLSVTTMDAPRTVAVFPDHPDKAALIFESTLTNLRFDSQMDGIVQIRDESARGRYIIIIEPFTQIISVTAPGYIQERLRVGSPTAREVRYFNVAPEQRSPDVISVIFNVTPADARLFVDDQETDINQTVQIEPGQRAIRIERDGFRIVQDVINVSSANILFTYNLVRVQQQLVRFNIQPAQAEVFIDNVREGAADARGVFDIFLFPRTYQLRISADGYLPVQTSVDVTEGQTTEFNYTLVRNSGILRLELAPANARIVINQRERTLTNGQIELPPGMHSLEITRPLHDSYIENISIERGQTVRRTISLTPHIGSLQMIVSPSDARVRLLDWSGREVQRWNGSQSFGDIPVGDYRLEVSASGYDTKIEELRITRDETTRLRVELSQSTRPVTQTPATRTQQPQAQTQKSPSTESIFKYPSFTSFTFSLSVLDMPNNNFSSNIESALGLGMYYQSFNGWLMSSYEIGFDRLTLTESAADIYDDNDYLTVYTAGIGLMPTLPLGPILVGIGGGLEYNQFVDYWEESFAYINTPYWRAYVSLFPKTWGVGLTVDYREAYMIKGYDDNHFQNWTRTNVNLLIRL
jgi:hypothetical protein